MYYYIAWLKRYGDKVILKSISGPHPADKVERIATEEFGEPHIFPYIFESFSPNKEEAINDFYATYEE